MIYHTKYRNLREMTVFKSANVNALPICKITFMENNKVKSFSNVKKGKLDLRLKPQQKLKCYDFL